MSPLGTNHGLRIAQLGEEATKGTHVPAEEIMVGATFELAPQNELWRNTAPHGVMAEFAGPTALLKKGVDISAEWDGISYEQIAWILANALDAPDTTGAGPYVHEFAPPGASLWVPLSYTGEFRHDEGVGGATGQEDVDVGYIMARSITLRGEQEQQWQGSADWFGDEIAAEGSFAALTVPTDITPLVVRDTEVFFNNTWALANTFTPAAGELVNQLISFEVNVETGLRPFHGVNNSDTLSEEKQGIPKTSVRLRMLVEPDATAEGMAAERVHAAAQDLRFITLLCTGEGNDIFRMVFSLKHEMGDFHSLGEADGMDVVEMNLLGHYDPTGAALVLAEVSNDEVIALEA